MLLLGLGGVVEIFWTMNSEKWHDLDVFRYGFKDEEDDEKLDRGQNTSSSACVNIY